MWKKLCERYDAKYIADEVQTGLMRCGEMWGYQRYGIEPDIMVTGKGISALSNLPLKYLHLKDTLCSDETIPELLQLKRVANLNLEGSKLSRDGWDRLRKGLPATFVYGR